VSRYGQVATLIDTAVCAYGRLDVLANVAGIINNQTVEQTIGEDFDRVMAVNVKGVLFGCKAAFVNRLAQLSPMHRSVPRRTSPTRFFISPRRPRAK
jgi:NAD(P)-dependent dehydrogenase (short-subunit alcohol dehydrogenase family)